MLLKMIEKETPSAFAPKQRKIPVKRPQQIPKMIFPLGVIGYVT